VRDGNLLFIEPIRGDQEPAAKPFLHRMASIAQRRLRVLHQQGVDVTQEVVANPRR
jgi:hypothetical protein